MKTISRIVIMVVLSVVLVTGAFLGGYAISTVAISARSQPAPAAVTKLNDGTPLEFKQDMPVFWEAWKIINDNFYKQPIDQDKMTYGAVGGMVDSLGDIHTLFEDPKTAAFFQSRLSAQFEGIGANVEMPNGRLTIVSPIKGSPAEKAGLQAGDVILQVDDTLIQNMDINQAVTLIRGPKGTTVHLKVQRGSGQAMDFTVTRDTINVPEVESKMLENNSIAYVQLNEFGDKAADQMHKALSDALAQNPKALILDLRGNPGGYLPTAIQIASEFIPHDQVALIEKFKDGTVNQYKTQDGGAATQIPMVLLVNEGSASASEIVSGALRDYKRALIIGQKTYGKGSVQEVHQLSDQSQLNVTVAHFFSPNDVEINNVGVSPDIAVDDPNDYEAAHGVDPQLQKAIDIIKSGNLQNPIAPTGSSMGQPPRRYQIGLVQQLRGVIGMFMTALRTVV